MTTMIGAPVEEAADRWRLTRHADVVAALADDRLEVPSPTPAEVASGGPMAAFRGSVSRFSNGGQHAERRAKVVRALEPVRAASLRDQTRARMSVVLAEARGDRIDVLPALRTVPVEVLAEAVGIRADRSHEAARQIALIAPAYPPGASPEAIAVADDAVTELTELLGSDQLATLGGLLVQACDATAALAGSTLAALAQLPVQERPTVETALATTLRVDPPVRATARIATADIVVGGRQIPAGSTVVLDLAAATRDQDDPAGPALTFGGGLRPCPGDQLALALAAGAVEAASRYDVIDLAYGPPGNIRIPIRLVVQA
jgi:cytochrome P450